MAMTDSFGPPPKRRSRKPAPSTTKRPAKKKRAASLLEDTVDVVLPMDGSAAPLINPATGALTLDMPDGSVLVDFAPQRDENCEAEHDDNLAEKLSPGDLSVIADELLEGIDADEQSRSEWMADYTKGIDLLGFKLEKPKSGAGSAPIDGMSVVRHPLMAESLLRFKANARAELLPANGPVKVRNDGAETPEADAQARALERDLNHYLTVTASEYYDDTDRLLLLTGFGGSGFKKVYYCPLRRRPVSESVPVKDLIVSNTATDLKNAARVTHRLTMRKSVMKRMQILGVYRDVSLDAPQPNENSIDRKIDSVQGVRKSFRPEDHEFELYECYCELDIPGFEHRHKGKISGLPLPYRVTIDKTSRAILEIRRNWNDDDEDFTAKTRFVHYLFETGFGFYGLGFLHILGNTTNALTAAWREMLDAGMFANFPGFLFAKSGNFRQTTNMIRVPPGAGAGIDTGGSPIQNVVMPLPYKEAGPGMMGLVDNISQTGQRLGSVSETSVGEGKQEAPVGTTLALIEQASKLMAAVHKRLHAAQAEEFRLLKELFAEEPSALWRGNKRAARTWNETSVRAALEDARLVPCADPNTPSQMHRLMKAMAIKQIAQMNPQQYDMRKVDARVMHEIGVEDGESLYAPPAPPPGPDPMLMAQLQLKQKDQAIKLAKLQSDAATKDKELRSKENIAVLNLANRLATHPESEGIVDQELSQLAPFLSPLGSLTPMQPSQGPSP